MKLKTGDGCTECNACQKQCPEGMKVYQDPNSKDCIRCLECTSCKQIHVVNSLPGKAKHSAQSKAKHAQGSSDLAKKIAEKV